MLATQRLPYGGEFTAQMVSTLVRDILRTHIEASRLAREDAPHCIANLSYEVDLFGRLKDNTAAARSDVESAEATYRSITLALQADLARTYLELREVDAEIVILLVLNSVEKLIMNLNSVYDTLTAVEKLANLTDKPIETEGTLELPPGEHQLEILRGDQVVSTLPLRTVAGEAIARRTVATLKGRVVSLGGSAEVKRGDVGWVVRVKIPCEQLN